MVYQLPEILSSSGFPHDAGTLPSRLMRFVSLTASYVAAVPVVIPAEARIEMITLDPGFRGGDGIQGILCIQSPQADLPSHNIKS